MQTGPETSRPSLECADLSALWSQLGMHAQRGTKAVTSHRTPRKRLIIHPSAAAAASYMIDEPKNLRCVHNSN
jgi:hypothetical protein